MRTNPPEFYTPPEVAELLRVRASKVIARIKAGELAAINLSDGTRPRYRIARAALEEFIQRRQVTPAPIPTRRQRRGDVPRYV